MVECTYDSQADAVYVHLARTPYSYGKDVDTERRVDFDSEDNPIGVELLCVSTGVNVGNLPERRRIAESLRSSGIKILP